MKFEELREMNYGDQIIMKDPLMGGGVPYVLMSSIKEDDREDYYFIAAYGASLLIKDQKTIDGFKVEKIDEDHPDWDVKLAEYGRQLGSMLDHICSDEAEGLFKSPPHINMFLSG